MMLLRLCPIVELSSSVATSVSVCWRCRSAAAFIFAGAGDDGVDDGRIDDDGDDDVSTAGDDVLADDFE